MKTKFTAGFIAALALALVPAMQAKDKGHGNKDHGKMEKEQAKNFKNAEKFERKVIHQEEHGHDHARDGYMAFPRSKFVLTQGNGYAGRGYYYGPPNAPYYYQHPDVRYFARREDYPNPRAVNPYGGNLSRDAQVQRALARAGYYQGPIDGRLGPQSMRAVSRYQQDHGMSVTDMIVPALLRALGIQ